MEAKLQKRVQRYGWDLAAPDYEALWQAQLASAQTNLLDGISIVRGERVLDVACGTGLVTLSAAEAVGPIGRVVGIDISGEMVRVARVRAIHRDISNATFVRMEAEKLWFSDGIFDVAISALGILYSPDPALALREMRRVVRPGGRIGLAVWGERSRCGWSAVFPITQAEVASDVCPLFFSLGQQDALMHLCEEARLVNIRQLRIPTTLRYANADEACNAAFIGGPVALAWSRFDKATQTRVRNRYIEAISSWRDGERYVLPGEFVVATATVP